MGEDLERSERWGRTYYAMGRGRFIWLAGVGYIGEFLGVVSVIPSVKFYIELRQRQHPAPWIAFWALPLFPIGGYLIGAIIWSHSEARYLEVLKKAKTEAADRQAIEDLTQEVGDLRRELRQAKDDRIQRADRIQPNSSRTATSPPLSRSRSAG